MKKGVEKMSEVNVQIFLKRSGRLIWKGKFLYDPETHHVTIEDKEIRELSALRLKDYFVVETNLDGTEKRDEFSITTKMSTDEIIYELSDVVAFIIEKQEVIASPPAN